MGMQREQSWLEIHTDVIHSIFSYWWIYKCTQITSTFIFVSDIPRIIRAMFTLLLFVVLMKTSCTHILHDEGTLANMGKWYKIIHKEKEMKNKKQSSTKLCVFMENNVAIGCFTTLNELHKWMFFVCHLCSGMETSSASYGIVCVRHGWFIQSRHQFHTDYTDDPSARAHHQQVNDLTKINFSSSLKLAIHWTINQEHSWRGLSVVSLVNWYWPFCP